MAFINKLGVVLTAVFLLSLVLLTLQILYILWRRRRLHQSAQGDQKSTTTSPSMELLYLCFCGSWKNHQANRIEPTDVTIITSVAVDEELEEMLKLHQLYGLSRALFTIKEESEKEDDGDSVVVIQVDDDGGEEGLTPPFTTPCGSPPYYTPSPSPARD